MAMDYKVVLEHEAEILRAHIKDARLQSVELPEAGPEPKVKRFLVSRFEADLNRLNTFLALLLGLNYEIHAVKIANMPGLRLMRRYETSQRRTKSLLRVGIVDEHIARLRAVDPKSCHW